MKYQIGSGLVSRQERIILCTQGQYIDVLTVLSDAHFIEALALSREKPAALLQDDIHWLPPLMYPSKLICLGANYNDHNAEMENTRPPKFPYCFLKPPTTTLVGSGETVLLPEYAKMIDWEVELAVIIGQRVRHVQGEAALASIAGYSIVNDLSARDWVPKTEHSYFGLDWVMSKDFDGAAPMGPFITPAEFVQTPQALTLTLTVNGQGKQHSNTASMVFSIQEIIEHLTTIMTLEPGDIIATGTPSGVGYGRKPPEFLRSGDRMVAIMCDSIVPFGYSKRLYCLTDLVFPC